MFATHSEIGSGHRLIKLQERDGIAIFADLDADHARITCPFTIEHVLPYEDRSIAILKEESNVPLLALCGPDRCDIDGDFECVLEKEIP